MIRLNYQLLWQLFSAFFRIGLFTFGGGYAMLPLFEKEVVERYRWASRDEMIDIYALAQSVPGVIALNTAIFLGNRKAGPGGAVAAACGMIAPSLIIIITIAVFFLQIQSNVLVLRVFSGIRAAVVGLIAAAAVKIGRSSLRDGFGVVLALTALTLSLYTELHAAWIIVGGGALGFGFYVLLPLRRTQGEARE